MVPVDQMIFSIIFWFAKSILSASFFLLWNYNEWKILSWLVGNLCEKIIRNAYIFPFHDVKKLVQKFLIIISNLIAALTIRKLGSTLMEIS